jgi:Tfp pilus assembly protein PilO
VAYVFAVHLPNRRALNRLRGDLALRQQGLQLASLGSEIASTQQGIAKANEYLQAVRAADDWTISGKLFGDISAIARQAGVRTRRFDPSPIVEHEQLRQLSLAMECEGNFEQVFELLSGLEAIPQPVWISSLQLRSSSTQQADLQCKLNLEIFDDKKEISD